MEKSYDTSADGVERLGDDVKYLKYFRRSGRQIITYVKLDPKNHRITFSTNFTSNYRGNTFLLAKLRNSLYKIVKNCCSFLFQINGIELGLFGSQTKFL